MVWTSKDGPKCPVSREDRGEFMKPPRDPIAFINERLADLAEANALYGKDQRLGVPDKIARNDREISWLKDLRSIVSLSRPNCNTPQTGD